MRRVDLFAKSRNLAQTMVDDIPEPNGGPGSSAPDLSASVLAQQAVISAVLADNAVYDEINEILSESDFTDTLSRSIYAAASAIIEGRNPLASIADPLSVVMSRTHDIDHDEVQALVQRAPAAGRDSVLGWAQLVAEEASERRLKDVIGKAQEIVTGDQALDQKSSEIHSLLEGANESRALPIVSAGKAAAQFLTEMAERAKSGHRFPGIETGFSELDQLLCGLSGGQMIVLAARPGIGKTALALGISKNVASSGKNVLVASLEMKATELSKRLISSISGVDGKLLKTGAMTEAEWAAAVSAAETLDALPLDFVDIPSVTLAAITALARRLRRAGRLDLLVIDYLQIIKTVGTRGTREQEISALTRGIKELAMSLGIPVLLLSQLNRGLELRANKRPVLSDLRESGSIEQDADVVVFLHNEDAMGGKSLHMAQSTEIIVAKARDAEIGDIELMFERATTTFREKTRLPVYCPAVSA
ncbi:hypothetical protein CBP36_19815 (plasmid) [Acidovorax carolinensis]|uniref:DNA 5'-3' helicase n=1 Tax=Acidovorax carolinensis TaxID=553814 RepID=A0A240UJC3_9BURK|nr:DnaB-like helicase C-terminal domain-containing protein [Acidovorax carolinensis]ART57156.1 hypothetical protein CBP35_19780 [Acidovorax carolinensis]ART61215.1 hypothetical protein CBP36_19815 [Acidovorax carolinensis]